VKPPERIAVSQLSWRSAPPACMSVLS
jgi:hypothetical protein